MNYVGLMSRLRYIIAEELVDPHLFPNLSLRSILFVGHGMNEADGWMDCVTTLGFEWFLESYEMRNRDCRASCTTLPDSELTLQRNACLSSPGLRGT